MDPIQYVDPTGHTLVARVPRRGAAAIASGSELVVEEDQRAVLLREGGTPEVFAPGRHPLAGGGSPPEGESSFQAVVVFTSAKTFADLKWGTREPAAYRDPELGPVRLRAFGNYAVRIGDPGRFVAELVAGRDLATGDGVERHLKGVIAARLSDALAETLGSILDLPRAHDDLTEGLRARVADDFAGIGVDLEDIALGAVTPPREVRARIARRGA